MNKAFRFLMLSTTILALVFIIYTFLAHIQSIYCFDSVKYEIIPYYFIFIAFAIWLILSFIKITNENYIKLKVLSVFLSIVATAIYLITSILIIPVVYNYYSLGGTEFYLESVILFVLSISASTLMKKPTKILETQERNKQKQLLSNRQNENTLILENAKTLFNNGTISQNEYSKIVEDSIKKILEK